MKNLNDIDISKFNFSAETDALFAFIKKRWNGVTSLKPKGYKKFTENYEDWDGMGEWQENEKEKEEKAFEGFDDAGVRCDNIVGKISTPQVAYSDICQGSEPNRSLIGAILSYGMGIGAKLALKESTKKMKEEVDAFNWNFMAIKDLLENPTERNIAQVKLRLSHSQKRADRILGDDYKISVSGL